ncbi:MAG TPA: 2OG-Fe(II) oxygenase [Sphingomicrobium sp.]|nr:2OG-Fe(II) oxygenase [Sphingomicrobium sp.]
MSDEFATAMGLLLGERPSLEDVQQAAQLLEAASRQGHAEASERLALLDALGSARPPDWGRSLDFLALAAEQGSPSAAEQLLLLADNQRDPVMPHQADTGFWKSVRERVALESRMTPGEKVSLSDSPRIRVIKRFASAAECRWMIALARPRLAPATVFDKATGEATHNASRDNSFFPLRLGEMSVLTEVIRNRISAATGLPVPLFEPSQVLHYASGQRFKLHHDFLDPRNPAYRETLAQFGQRIATFLIYLNAGYSGGETSFPAISLHYRADEGDALFFANVTQDGAPDPKTLHAGLPPQSGEKWVFSQWIRDRFPGQ